jgi:cell division topological specificity factor
MSDFFNRMLGRDSNEKKGSGATAKDRLKMVLTHDRIQVSPEKLNEMRAEIIAVIAKYVPEVEPESVEISIEQTDRFNNRIVAQIPISKSRQPSVDKTENIDFSPLLEDAVTLVPQSERDEVQSEKTLPMFDPDADEDTVLTDSKSESDNILTILTENIEDTAEATAVSKSDDVPTKPHKLSESSKTDNEQDDE